MIIQLSSDIDLTKVSIALFHVDQEVENPSKIIKSGFYILNPIGFNHPITGKFTDKGLTIGETGWGGFALYVTQVLPLLLEDCVEVID